jgi:SulP family sulfate permease
MAGRVQVEGSRAVADQADGDGQRQPYDPALATDRDVVVYRISGAFFFGAAATVAAGLDRLAEHPKAYVLDFSAVPLIDSTGPPRNLLGGRKAPAGPGG